MSVGMNVPSHSRALVELAVKRMHATGTQHIYASDQPTNTNSRGSAWSYWSQGPSLLFDFDELDDCQSEPEAPDPLPAPPIQEPEWKSSPPIDIVIIAPLTGHSLCTICAASLSWRVNELKAEIERIEGTAIKRQKLLFGNQLLCDHDMLCNTMQGASCAEVGLMRVEPLWAGLIDQVANGEVALEDLDESARSDRSLVMAAVKVSQGRALAHASLNLRGDRELVLEAVRRNGLSIRHATDDMRKDTEIARTAVKEWPRAV